MLRRPPRSTRTDTLFPTRRSSDLKITDTRSNYMVSSREELAKVGAQVKSLSSVVRGRQDTLARTTLRSPVRGIVKRVDVTTIGRSEEHTSELQSLMRISYAVFCLKKKNTKETNVNPLTTRE